MTKKLGQPTKLLKKDVKDTIISFIRNGNYIKTACMAAGISNATFHNWVNRAGNYHPDNGDEQDKIYFDFLEELKMAEAENIARNVQNIQSYGDSSKQSNWTASAWLLERKYPSEFGRRMELEVGPSKVLIALQERARQYKELTTVDTIVEER